MMDGDTMGNEKHTAVVALFQKEQIMNGNYEWQKQQANERIQTRLHEGEAHRQAKTNNDQQPAASLLMVAIPLLVGVIVVIWLLTGCSAATDLRAAETEMVVRTSTVDSSVDSGWTMAARIQLQDKREAYLTLQSATESPMTARIRFHDRLWENKR